MLILLPWSATGQDAAGQRVSTPGVDLLAATVDRYCLGCHNDRTRTAGLTLAGVADAPVGEQAPVLEKVLHKLRTGEMPPAGRPAPDPGDRAELVAWLETGLDRAAAERPDPGSPAIHRLNRAEYRNAVRDLLGLDLDHARDLPADDSGYGFDNIGDVLTVSPLHVEKYVAAARRVSRLVVGTGAPVPVVQRYRPSGGAGWDGEIAGLPPNTRGGILFNHHFPFDAEYAIQVRVRGRRAPGMPPPKLDVRVDGARVRLLDADFDAEEANQGSRIFEVRMALPAGEHEVAAGFLTEYARREGAGGGTTNGVSVDYVLVGGPYGATGPGDPESRRRLFVCRPAAGEPEAPCARRILTTVARRAYRRPVTDADVEPLMRLFAMGRADGGSFDHGIEMALSGVLVSPSFLFRAPAAPAGAGPGDVHRLADLDLASRLSFFLWSSIPDEELLQAAEQGGSGRPTSCPARSAACSPTRRRGPSWRTSRGSGSTCATSPTGPPTPSAFPTSTTASATRSSARRSSSWSTSSGTTAASWSCWTPTTRSSTRGWPTSTASTGSRAATSGGFPSPAPAAAASSRRAGC